MGAPLGDARALGSAGEPRHRRPVSRIERARALARAGVSGYERGEWLTFARRESSAGASVRASMGRRSSSCSPGRGAANAKTTPRNARNDGAGPYCAATPCSTSRNRRTTGAGGDAGSRAVRGARLQRRISSLAIGAQVRYGGDSAVLRAGDGSHCAPATSSGLTAQARFIPPHCTSTRIGPAPRSGWRGPFGHALRRSGVRSRGACCRVDGGVPDGRSRYSRDAPAPRISRALGADARRT